MTPDHLPVLGLMRFSFYGPTDTRQRHASQRDIDALYDPARMEERFRLFEAVCLPTVTAQTDTDHSIDIITSQIMPPLYQDRLRDLVSDKPHVTVHLAETMNISSVTAPIIRRERARSTSGRVATFRIDDDDALSQHYVAKLRSAAAMMPERSVVTFPHSLALFRDFDGSLGIATRKVFCASPGLCRMNGPGYLKNPFLMMHGIVWRNHLTLSDASFVSSIQSYHSFNDTAVNRDKNVERLKLAVGRSYGTDPYWSSVHQILAAEFPTLSMDVLSRAVQAMPRSGPAIEGPAS